MMMISNSRQFYRCYRYAMNWRSLSISSSLLQSIQPTPSVAAQQQSSILGPQHSFAMGIFMNQMNTKQIFPFPDALSEESKDTVKLALDSFGRYFDQVHDAVANDANESFDQKAMETYKQLGGLGLLAPEEYGGFGLLSTQYARLIELFGGHDLSFSITIGAHQSLGYKGLLLYGNEQQKNKYLPMLSSGQKLAAYCLTEPTAGSDANSIRTTAVLDDDGQHYTLNGNKIWITNGGLADFMVVFAQVPHSKDHSNEVQNAMTAFIVERDYGGVTSSPPEKKMGLKSSNTTAVYFDNVKVPVQNVLGKVGEGFKVAVNILNNGRFALSALMTGFTRMLLTKSIQHVNQRQQFGHKLIEFQSIQEKIAQIAMSHYAIESVAFLVSNNMDRGVENLQLEAAIGKIYATETAWDCCDECIQLLGGAGYMRENHIERFMRDVRVYRIFEGASDTLRQFIATTGIRNAAKVLSQKHSNSTTVMDDNSSNVTSSDRDELLQQVAEPLRPSAAQLAQQIEDFGSVVEHLLFKHGKHIANQQFLLTRIANASIELYVMAAVLSRATNAINENLPTSDHEQLLATTFVTKVSLY